MLKKTLLLSTLLLSGCAERGYQLTTNTKTDTVTAESSVDIGNYDINIDTELNKMQKAVKKQRLKNKKQLHAEKTITEVKTREKALKSKKIAKAQKRKETLQQDEAKILKAEKLAIQKHEENVRKSRLKAEKAIKDAHAKRKKEVDTLIATNKVEALKEKKLQEVKRVKSLALANEKIRNEKADKEAKKIIDSQKALESKNNEILRKSKIEKAKIEKAKIQEQEKLVQEKRLQVQNNKTHTLKNTPAQKYSTASTQPLKFKLINKVFHKFGSSEVHGHVVYIDKGGKQLRLAQSKAYLLPVSATMNHWYNNFYLKNNTGSVTTTANYLNSTYLNLEKNFNFYGVAEGSYYVVIEANYPSHIAKNKKIYVAKKIKVEKNKKIMAVFSKKL